MGNEMNLLRDKNDDKSTNLGQSGTILAEQAKNVASSLSEKAKDRVASMAHTVGEVGSSVGEKAREATSAVGGGMKSLAGAIRENTPRAGALGTASSNVANTLESGGRYLQEADLVGMAEDVSNAIRRNPIPAVLVGIGIGFLLAKTTTRS